MLVALAQVCQPFCSACLSTDGWGPFADLLAKYKPGEFRTTFTAGTTSKAQTMLMGPAAATGCLRRLGEH